MTQSHSAVAPYDRGSIFRAAENYRSRNKIRKAIREYEKILSVDARDIEVHAKIAPLYIRAGRKIQAKASLAQVIARYEKQGFVEKAIASLRLALTLERRDLPMRMHLVDLYLDKSHVRDALKVLYEARKAFRGKKHLKQAMAVEDRILSLAPDDFHAQVSLIRLMGKAGKRQQMILKLGHMEKQWAQKGNRQNWRKTRWLACRFTPSVTTGWGYMISLFTAPAP